jgi:hypothetical protein
MIAGKTDLIERRQRVIDRVDDLPARAFDADAFHRLAETLAALRFLDPIRVGADHLDAIALEHACMCQLDGQVESGLTAECWQNRVGPLLFDDALDDFRCERFDIGGVSQLGIGHDRGRVGVHQDHPIPLGLQCFAGLRAGVIELTGLSDHNGPGSQNKNGADVGSLGHGSVSY